jgi:hypothetical protein
MILSGEEIDAQIRAAEQQRQADQARLDRSHYHFVIKDGLLISVQFTKNIEENRILKNIDFTFEVDGKIVTPDDNVESSIMK